jgi:hypothetical protein
MFFTARQLEDLHKSNGSNGHVILPYRARLSPLAQDWVRARKVALGYSDADASTGKGAPASKAGGKTGGGAVSSAAKPESAAGAAGAVLWWCDGPCGPAKAAIASQAKESNLRAIELPPDGKKLVSAIKLLAQEIKAGHASGGILLVQNAAVATVFANRCPSLRAVVGTCLEAVEQGIQQAAANVLVIEHPYKSLPQVKSLLGRFVRGPREVSEDLRRQLQELSSCG